MPDLKIHLLAFKAIHGLAPAYISNLLPFKCKSTINLKSNLGILLGAPKGKMLETLASVQFIGRRHIYKMSCLYNYAIYKL